MPRLTLAPLVQRQALEEILIYAGKTPGKAQRTPAVLVRALRSKLKMSQADPARRARMPQAQVARIESGKGDVQLGTLRRLFDAMFCDLLILPKPRKRPGDALADRRLERPWGNPWA
jgi:hypothetical protein